ncbi:TetR/AcrR family transcriptional regulator C-terminal domain-containing protein [Levilactobacillus spicheri]
MAASETKERIAESLASLLNHNTFDKITVREIADEAEVHRKTFYYYFADKYELLAFVYQQFIVAAPRHDKPVTITLENWRPETIQLLERIADHSKLFLNAYPYDDGVWRQSTNEFVAARLSILLHAMPEYRYLKEDVIDTSAEFIAAGAIGIINKWANDNFKASPRTVLDQMTTANRLFNGILDRWNWS